MINVLVGIELHVDWLAGLLDAADAKVIEVIEVEARAEAAWGQHLQERAAETLYPKARSYYNGDEIRVNPACSCSTPVGYGRTVGCSSSVSKAATRGSR